MVAALCSPEDSCPGTGLGVTDSGSGLQILGAAAVTFDADLHSVLYFDCALNAGQGGYLVGRTVRRIYTAAERAALAGANKFIGLEVYESDTFRTYVWDGTIWQPYSPRLVLTHAQRIALAGAYLYNGLRVYESDTTEEYVYNGSAWIMVSTLAAWTAYTVQAKQAVNITSTVSLLDFTREGRLVHVQGKLTITSAGTAANEVKLTPTGLPAPAANSSDCLGGFKYRRAGSFARIGAVEWDGTDIRFMCDQSVSPLYLGAAAATFTTANGDVLTYRFTYEPAA